MLRLPSLLLCPALVSLLVAPAEAQTCDDMYPGCFKPVHEMPGFHEKADHLTTDQNFHVNPFGGQATLTAIDVDLPSLMEHIGLRMVRVHNSGRLKVPLPLPGPQIHDGPLGLGWTFHFGVLWPPELPEQGSSRWSLVNGDGSVEVFYVHSHLSSQLPITSAGSNQVWISASMNVLRLVTANQVYEILTPN